MEIVVGLLIGGVPFAYLATGALLGRRASRAYYIAKEAEHHERWPSLSYEKHWRDFDFHSAVGLFFLVLFLWPGWLAWRGSRRTLAAAIPEYQTADLEDRIMRQKAEIDRLHREMGIRP